METNEVCEQAKKKNIVENVISFLKSHKRLTIAMVAVLAAIAICITVVTVLHSAQAKKIEQAQVGMCYIMNYDSEYSHDTEIWYFWENGYSRLSVDYADETRQKVDFLNGSLKEISGPSYTVKISLFGQHTLNGFDIEVDDHMRIVRDNRSYGGVWTPISLEEALAIEAESNAQYAITKCEHEFGSAQVIKKSTCSTNGEEKQVCTICGYEQIEKIKKLGHNYVNKVCSVCGTKKTAEKSDIKANTWYTNGEGVRCQNIQLVDVTPLNNKKGMQVAYYFVCQHCHAIDDSLLCSVPEFNYDIEKIYTCEECGKTTIVKIELG